MNGAPSGSANRSSRGVPPPGFSVVQRVCPSRTYNVYVAPDGVVYRSASSAWSALPCAPCAPPSTLVCMGPPPVPPHDSRPAISPALQCILEAFSIDARTLPPGVSTCIQAAFHPECPPYLAAIAQADVALQGPEHLAPQAPVPSLELPPPAETPSGTDDPSVKGKEIAMLRALLPPGCERRMVEAPGDDWSYDQASAEMRETAVVRKFESAAGPSGKAAARDRRYLSRYVSYCKEVGVSSPFPVGSIVFLNFAKHAAASSTGKRGGATVEYSIKVSFLHMKHNFGLDLRFESPLLFNTIKPYKGDSDSATSPSLFVLSLWERGASEAPTAVGRLACAVATLACHLTLRASHFVGTVVHSSASAVDVRLTLGSDKDGSSKIWAGCAAAGMNGPFLWWPSFLASARERGFLVPGIVLATGDSPAEHDCGIKGSAATSTDLTNIFHLAFSMAGINIPTQKLHHFTGHSPRHLYPCIGELLAWLQKFVDELGRWATGAANAKKSNCGQRYSVAANQALQLHLRSRICEVLVALRDEMAVGDEGLLPSFAALSVSETLRSHLYFGPQGVGYVPSRR